MFYYDTANKTKMYMTGKLLFQKKHARLLHAIITSSKKSSQISPSTLNKESMDKDQIAAHHIVSSVVFAQLNNIFQPLL